jgi:hypothetical protein
VPTAITERFCMGADGELEPLTSGSTGAVVQVVTHAGICKVERYAFSISWSAAVRRGGSASGLAGATVEQ